MYLNFAMSSKGLLGIFYVLFSYIQLTRPDDSMDYLILSALIFYPTSLLTALIELLCISVQYSLFHPINSIISSDQKLMRPIQFQSWTSLTAYSKAKLKGRVQAPCFRPFWLVMFQTHGKITRITTGSNETQQISYFHRHTNVNKNTTQDFPLTTPQAWSL